jgi:hypothetical protein
VKVKKATKRLNKVEALLSAVLDGYATDIAEIREPLEAAAAAVKRAKSAIDSDQSSNNQLTASTSGRAATRRHRVTADGGERTSGAANKRVASAKRKGSGSATASAASRGKSSQTRPISAKGLKAIAESNKRRAANRRATRNAPTTAAQRKSNARKETAPGTGAAAQEVPANDLTTQTSTSVPASA